MWKMHVKINYALPQVYATTADIHMVRITNFKIYMFKVIQNDP